MNIDLNLYKTFYTVAKYNSFTKAAQELFISQPAVTQSIKKLEDQLNIELFKRTSNGVVLTKAGEIVYFYSQKICDLAIANNEMIEIAKQASFEVINVGVPTHIGSFYFISYLTEFNKKNPNVKFNIINKKSDEMIKMLEKRELDIVIDTDIYEYNVDIIDSFKINDLVGCFVCNSNLNNIIKDKKLTADELIKYPLILPGKTTSNRKSLDKIFEREGVKLDPLIEANSSTISKGIIMQGVGIGWMIKDFVKTELDNRLMFEINVNVPEVSTPVCIAYNKKFNHDIVNKFIKTFKDNRK